MKVCALLNRTTPTLSFEFFPPSTPEQEANLFQVIAELKVFSPDFVSVTYGAMGNSRERTFFWADKLKKDFQIEPIAHLTCIAATKESIHQQLTVLKKIGVENILALRGDPPQELKELTPPVDGFRSAKDLILFIRQDSPQFCLGGAGFPEGHPSTLNLDLDIRYLKEKIAAGAEYIITQLFFDNNYYFNFLEKCRNAGITAPIIPGIMPISSLRQVKKMTETCGAIIPPPLLSKLENHSDDPATLTQIGIEQAVNQCQELLTAKVPGIHFFVLNRSEPISQILRLLPFHKQ